MLAHTTPSPMRKLLALGGFLLLVGLAQADDFWKSKPPSDWTAKEALKLLGNSPWAHEELVSHPPYRQETEVSGGITIWSTYPDPPLPPSGPATESNFIVRYLVRWESAEPVAQAFARLEQLGEDDAARAKGPAPRLPPDRYIVTVLMTRPPRGGPVGYDRRDLLDDLDEDELRDRAWLETKQGRVTPLEVERTWVGPVAAIHFSFPRTVNSEMLFRAQRELEEVEFGVKGKMFVLKSKFALELYLLL